MKKSLHVITELVAIFSSVLIFWSLWELLDRIALIQGVPAQCIVLLVGSLFFSISLNKLTHAD